MGKESEQQNPLEQDHDNHHHNTTDTEQKTTFKGPHQHESEDENVLKFMDSLDSYLTLMHSLSSTLRQGWFDVASARYSMGGSRVNSVLLDLKEHPAATHLEVEKDEDPHFTLGKWAAVDAGGSTNTKDGEIMLKDGLNSVRQRHKDSSTETQEDSLAKKGNSNTANDHVQRERKKSLAVFGAFVSPKLQSAQLSFETALETLVEIAKARASMLSAFDQVRGHTDGMKD